MVDFGEHDRWARRHRRLAHNGVDPGQGEGAEAGVREDLVEVLRQADENTADIWQAYLHDIGHRLLTNRDVAVMLKVSTDLREHAIRLALED